MISFHLSKENENAFSKISSSVLTAAHQQFYLKVLLFIYSFAQHFLGACSEPGAVIDTSQREIKHYKNSLIKKDIVLKSLVFYEGNKHRNSDTCS